MATAKTKKARAEVEKARLKLAEQQTKLKELEAKQTESENMEIVDIVRGFSIPLDDLAAVLQSLKGAALPAAPATSGHVDPKSTAPQIKNGIDEIDADGEDETE
jgi:hypothetical protein